MLTNYFLQASTVGGHKDFTGVICCSSLNNPSKTTPRDQSPSIAFTTGVIESSISSDVGLKGLVLMCGFQCVEISHLVNLKLITPLSAVIEADDDAFIARSVDLPVFGFADDPIEAITSLKREIESLYYDLMADDNFSSQWLGYKDFLRDKVAVSR